MNFSDFKAKVKAVIFPIGEPENLVPLHDTYIQDALHEIQQSVKCYRDNNTDVVAVGDTRYNCGLTVAEAPDGFIKRVYSVGSDWCCKVNYAKSTLAYLRQECSNTQLELGAITSPDQHGKGDLPLGDKYPDASSDSTLGRAVTGYWAMEGCRLYVWPYLQSTEDLVIEWEGVKGNYADADLVFDDHMRVQRAVRLYLQREIARDLENDPLRADRLTTEVASAFGDLVWFCRQKTEGHHATVEDTLPVLTNTCSTLPVASANPHAPVSNPWLYRFAIVGNYGIPSGESPARPTAVATLVKSWDPSFVVTTGGNAYAGTTLSEVDYSIGKLYNQFIYPYVGSAGPGAADRNRFWPCTSAAEHYSPASLAAYVNYFTLPPENGELYYDHIEGPVHLFMMDANAVTGNAADSDQAEWLRIKLSASPCKYKIVVLSQSPYDSFETEVPTLRWPFKQWGATTVVAGGPAAYERLFTDNIPFMVNGLGGYPPLLSTVDPSLFSVKTYFANNGAQLVTVNCDSIKFEFFNTAGTLVDTLEIKQ